MKLSAIIPCFLIVMAFLAPRNVVAQADSTSEQVVNQDAIFDRPFINMSHLRTAVGGYVEANTNYFAEDGITEGFSMEMRRFNIFLYSDIHDRIKLLSELEFEHGTEEIGLETAFLDVEINSGLFFRAGILLPQIGLVNANHDSPKWEFVDRPLSSTTLIPSTLAEVGFGIHGKLYPRKLVLSYDAYITNGLQSNIVNNEEGKTFVPAGKSDEMFGEDNNGTPMYNAKISVANRKAGEYGMSYYGGAYNTFQIEGEIVDNKRRVHILAFDITLDINKTAVKGEYVLIKVDVPANLLDLYGNTQQGGFIEVSRQIMERKILKFEKAKLFANVRGEYIDYNMGDFTTIPQTNIPQINNDVNLKKGDELSSVMIGLSFRPVGDTVFKFNYRFQKTTDLVGNPPALLGGFQFGLATYF